LGAIEQGNVLEVELEIPEIVSGFQWTMETNGLEYAGISSPDILINDQNVGLLENGIITMSWNGNVLDENTDSKAIKIHVKFNVLEKGRILNMMDLSGKITAAEAYTREGEILDVNLIFNSSGVFTDFALYQNKPNPWRNQTVIGFHIPESAFATLTIYDIDGKIVKAIAGNYHAGYNSVTLSSQDIPHTGVLYYRLECGEYSASKKMVIVQ
jgi:hypothetical protein